jgi:transcriptional regulator with XRE-family HTH domain
MPLTSESPSAEELRMERERRLVPVYQLGARAGIHPGRLSQYLRGSIPMPSGVAERIAAALGMAR